MRAARIASRSNGGELLKNESLVTSHASRIIQVVESGLQPAGIEPLVTRSWHRCLREYGIEPSAPRQTSVLSAQSVKQLQEGLGQLLPVARAEMESLYEQIAGSGFAVILADTQGAVLSSITDPALRAGYRRCRRLNAAHGKSYFLATLLLPAGIKKERRITHQDNRYDIDYF